MFGFANDILDFGSIAEFLATKFIDGGRGELILKEGSRGVKRASKINHLTTRANNGLGFLGKGLTNSNRFGFLRKGLTVQGIGG